MGFSIWFFSEAPLNPPISPSRNGGRPERSFSRGGFPYRDRQDDKAWGILGLRLGWLRPFSRSLRDDRCFVFCVFQKPPLIPPKLLRRFWGESGKAEVIASAFCVEPRGSSLCRFAAELHNCVLRLPPLIPPEDRGEIQKRVDCHPPLQDVNCSSRPPLISPRGAGGNRNTTAALRLWLRLRVV